LIRTEPRSRLARKVCRVLPLFDRLEARQVLSTTVVGPVVAPAAQQVEQPMHVVHPSSGNGQGGYSPTQVLSAYGFTGISFNGVAGTGAGQTIAIVDAYNDPKIASDLAAFDAEYSLPAATLNVVNQTGGTSLPGVDSTGGWELEESLDVEWAHAIAPGAKIDLVEASSATDTNLLAAVQTASTTLGASVVSMSWGGSEFNGETSYDSDFNHAGVVYVAASGDSGPPAEWPAASSNVLAVGGTSLAISGGTYSSESGWSGSGSGPSSYETQPAYQKGVVTQTTTQRAVVDVSYNADPNEGYSVYDSDPYNGQTLGWLAVGGTSAGSPQWAALTAIADQGRAASGMAAINATNPEEIQTLLYKNPSAFHDITTGSSGQYSAATGYDYVTGLGSPIASAVVQTLDGTTTSKPADHLVVSGASTDVAGGSYTLTVTAETPTGAVDPSYTGTVKLTSGDGQAGLPALYTFTSANVGSHQFTVTLKTAGTESITATAGAGSAIESGIVVSPAAASQFVIGGLSSTAGVGSAVSFTVTAEDPYGNVATGYTGTVRLTSTDPAATLPASVTFTGSSKGVASASVTFKTAGTESITATAGGITKTSSGVTVSPTGTITLTASAASTTAINLSWNQIAGATGYTIQKSLNGTGSWTTITTTAPTASTYAVTGLASGTTYSFRVQATGGNGSPYSNAVGATTQGTTTTTGGSLTLYANSYAPPENDFSFGSYELGMKIESSAAGQVTALRFYKQTWMGGENNVGHLWSPTGTLLATATFTNETASGWQQVTLSNPVSIAANSVYIVSFSTGGGLFGLNSTGLKTGVSNGVLQGLGNGVSGGDGVYGPSGRFPTTSGNGYDFYVDLAFSPTSSSSGRPAAQAGPLVALTTATGGSTALASSTSVSSSTPKVQVGAAGGWASRWVASDAFTSTASRSRAGFLGH
jgi:hypothetical protein